MSTRVVCPDCGDRLKLHKPAIDNTRVKCRNCGAKFYAGKAENWSEESERPGGFHPLPGISTLAPEATAVVRAEPGSSVNIAPAIESEATPKRRHRQEHRPNPPWVMPVGIAVVLGIALAGIFLGQPPAVPEVSSKPSSPEKPAVHKPDSVVAAATTFRPPELIGVWETNDVPGGRLEMAADGTINIRGAFLTDEKLELMSRWFIVRVDGDEFVLEVGPEPRMTSNHQVRLVRRPDGSIVMTRYASLATLCVKERHFTKVQ